jgi:hypothetical protein
MTSDIEEEGPVAEGEQVRITQAKGRPMLSWVGKRPLREVRAFPAQLVERFAPEAPAGVAADTDWTGWPVSVTIDEVLSPSILERLAGQEGILQPRVDDWRAMVDTVAIDPSYDGSVFEVGLLDVPARKRDLVEGTYEIPVDAASPGPVAVRITDMLGEEILVVEAQ